MWSVAVDGRQAVALSLDLQPDVVIMDLDMPWHGRHRGHPPDRPWQPTCRNPVLTMLADDDRCLQR